MKENIFISSKMMPHTKNAAGEHRYSTTYLSVLILFLLRDTFATESSVATSTEDPNQQTACQQIGVSNGKPVYADNCVTGGPDSANFAGLLLFLPLLGIISLGAFAGDGDDNAIVPQPLFTPNDDNVDFNTASAGQIAATPDLYDALAGDDVVQLPSTTKALEIGYNFANPFNAGPGHDTILGHDGPDILHGGEGNDLLVGDDNNDNYTFDGDFTDYLFTFVNEADGIRHFTVEDINLLNGMEGTDTIGVSIADANGTDSITFGGDTYSLHVGNNNINVLSGSAILKNFMLGGAGSDVLKGGNLDDIILGGDDNDLIQGLLGNNWLDGGNGNDTVSYDMDARDVHIDLTNGMTSVLTFAALNSTINEIEANDSIATAQDINNPAFWGTDPNNTIYYSTTIPHTTVIGTGDNTSVDFYKVTVTGNTPVLGIFDIDSPSFDSQLFLYDSGGNLLAHNDDNALDNDPTIPNSMVSYLFTTPGDYYISVQEFISSTTGGPIPSGITYNLNVSLENHNHIPGWTEIYTDTLLSFENSTGGNGQDILNGNDADNQLNGNPGNDFLYGLLGNDTLNGGNDDDQLYGGAGMDLLFGDNGNDFLEGGADNDTLHGGLNDDLLVGDVAISAQNLTADLQNITVVNGDDSLLGEGDIDTLFGDNQEGGVQIKGISNIITSNFGNDTLRGDASTKSFLFGDAYDASIVAIGNSNQVTLNFGDDEMSSATTSLLNADARIYSIEIDGDDNVIQINAGNDTLAPSGTETVNGEGGFSGNFITGNRNTVINKTGTDTITGKAGGIVGDLVRTISEINGDFNSTHNQFGNDTINVTSATFLRGDALSTTLDITNTSTNNTARYDFGNDTIVTGQSTSIDGDSLIVEIELAATTTTNTIIFNFGHDTIQGGATGESIYGEGSSIIALDFGVNNTVNLIFGSDSLSGGGGNDRIYGDFRFETFVNVDLLIGGNDTIYGGAGDDTLQGRSVSDPNEVNYFQYNDTSEGSLNEHIIDFIAGNAAAHDVLDFTGLAASLGGFTNATIADYVYYTQSGLDTIVQIDIDGFGGSAVLIDLVVLDGVTAASMIHGINDIC